MHNFKKIVLSSLLLMFFVIGLLFGFMAPYFYGNYYNYQDNEIRKSLSGKLDTLIIGSSHALRAFKPNVINDKLGWNSYNMASPLMSMYGRYTLLRKEVERNPIKNVIIEVSYNAMTIDRTSLGLEGDIYVLGRLDNFKERINFITNDFNKDDYSKIFSDTLQRSANSWKHMILGYNKETLVNQYGYLPVPKNDLSFSFEVAKKINNSKYYTTEFLKENLNYLDKIMILCKENNIKVIMVVTPISDLSILEYVNHEEIFSQYIDLAKKYNIEYYDFNLDKKRLELYPEDLAFYDYTHLSDDGAEVFSNRFAEIMNNKKKGQQIEKEFVDSYDMVKENILRSKS